MTDKSIGLIELSSIAAGFAVADAMLKAGDVRILLSRSILSEVVQHKTAVLSSDASADSRFQGARSIIMQGIRSTMTVPLLHQVMLFACAGVTGKTRVATSKDTAAKRQTPRKFIDSIFITASPAHHN